MSQLFNPGELILITVIDLMARKPRNARTERLTDWRFFFQIYLVSRFVLNKISSIWAMSSLLA